MAQYTITYFDLRGRAEPMRLLLADQGCEWKEDKVLTEDWMCGKAEIKKTLLFGQLPKFADGDFILFQSNTILRYLGRKHDLYGKNIKEAALIDMANDGLEDLRKKFAKFFFFEWDTGKEKYMEDLPNELRPFEHLLSKNASGYLAGSKVCYADYNLLDLLQSHLIWAPDCLNSFPALKAFKEKMESRPKLKTYLQSSDHKNRLFHPTRKV